MIEDARLELEFSAEAQDRDFIKQMAAENGHLFLRRVTPACFPHGRSDPSMTVALVVRGWLGMKACSKRGLD